nr:YadA-like family protein [uncultured Aggregatibacter sp.]
MNHIYKSIFNKALGVFTAVPEFASAHGKGSERTVVGRVAKGTAGFAASALAISVGLALTSTSAVASAGIYVNDGTDVGCVALPDSPSPNTGIYGIVGNNISVPNSMVKQGHTLPANSYLGLDKMNPCRPVGDGVHAAATQTNRTLFYGNTHTVDTTNNGSKNLTLGGRLDVNSGIIGVGDRGVNGTGATNSIRMGTGTTLADANKVVNGIAIGVNTQATSNYATAIGEEALANGSDGAVAVGRKATANANAGALSIGYDAVTTGKSGIAQGYHAHTNAQSGLAIGDNAKASGIGQVAIGYASNAQKADIDKAATAAPNKADYSVTVGHYAGADYTGTNNIRSTLVGDSAGRYGEEGNQNTAVGSLAGMYVKGSNNVALGMGSGSGSATEKLEASETISIGHNAKASKNTAIAMGTTAKARTEKSIALGENALAGDPTAPTVKKGEYSTAIGSDTTALGYGATAVGSITKAKVNYATALGHEAEASGTGETSLGYGAGANSTSPNGNRNGVSVGTNAGRYAISGGNNVAVGISAGQYVEGDNNVAQGYSAGYYIKGNENVSIGTNANVGSATDKLEANKTVAIGSGTKASANNAIAMGNTAQATAEHAAAIGNKSVASSVSAIALGRQAQATDENAVALGADSKADGHSSFAGAVGASSAGTRQVSIGHYAGNNTQGSSTPAKPADHAVFIGNYAGSDAAGTNGNTNGVAIGSEAGRYLQSGSNNTAIGSQAGQYVEGSLNASLGQGAGKYVKGSNNIAMGTGAGSGTATDKLEVSNTTAIGNNSKALTDDSITIGRDSKAGKVDKFDGKKSIAIGYASEAMGSNAIALGSNAATNNGHDSIAMGTYAKTNGEKTISIGAYNTAEGAQSIVIAGNYDASTGSNRSTTTAAAKRAIVVGPESHATAEDALAIGNKNTVASARTYAIGNNINVAAGADDSLVFGTKAAVGAANTVAIGANANAAQANSVALGAGSATSDAHTTGDYTLNGSYTAAGLPAAANGTVSVGSAGKERQIQNVAAGVISAASTDAINGSQLYATNNYLSNLAGGVKNVLGGDAAIDNAGNVTMSNIGGTGKGNVNDAIAAANTKVAAGDNITVTPTTNADGSKTYTVATKKDLVVDSVKAGDSTLNTDGLAITGGPSVKKDGINAGNKKITGVANGNVAAGSTDAVNGGQLAEVKSKADSAVQNVVSGNPTALTANKVGDTVTLTPNFIEGDLVNADGTVNAPAAADEGKLVSAKTVADALKANHFVVDTKANGGTVDAASEENAKVGSGNKVTFEAGKNLVAQQTNTANGGATVNYKLSDTLENLVSVKSAEIEAGIGPNKVVLNNNGVKVGDSTLNDKGLTINNGPSVTDAGINAGDKKITGVADGNVVAGSTDAVNGGQLAEVKAKADSAVQDVKSGNENALTAEKDPNTNIVTVTPKLSGDLVDANGNITAPTTPADKGKLVTAGTVAEALANTHFVVDTKATDGELDAASQADQKIKASNKVTLQAGKNLKAKQTNGANGAEVEFSLKDSISLKEVKVGEGSANEVVLNDKGVNVAGNTYINKDGLNANDKKITNVAPGAVTAASKDAVNGSQLYNVANNVKDLIGPDATIDPATGKVTVADPAKGIGETGKGNIGDAIKHVNDAAKAAAETAAKHTTVVEGKNVKVTKGKNAAGGDEYTVATKDDLEVTSVNAGNTTVNTNGLTITGGPSVTRGGIDAGNRVISGVKAGDVSATSQEAVNGSQLHATNTKLDGVKAKADTAVQDVKSGDENALTVVKDPNTNIVTVTPKLSGDLVDANGNITAPTTPADKGKLVTAGTVADALANTHFVVDTKATDGELDAASQADQKIKAGNKVTLQAGKNLKAKQTNGANGAQVEFSLKDSISLKEVTAGEGANQVVLGNDGVKVGGNTYINNDGLNANGNKITNVKDGVDPTDAVNKGQLDAVKTVADSAVKSVKAADGEENLVVDNTDSKNPKLSLKKDLTVDSVKAGDSTLNTDGLTIAGGPSVKKDGINAGDKTITNVAPGAVTPTSKDAVNGGQLYNVANNVKDLIGPDATIDPATGKVTVTDPAKGIAGTGKGTIGEAIKSVKDKADTAVQDIKSGDEKALSVTKAGNTYTITPNLSGDLVDADGNITAPATDADKGKLVTAGTVAQALANTHFVVDTKATDGELDGASEADQKIKAGNKVTLQAGKNLKAKQTNGANGAQVEFSLKDSISLKEVTAGEGDNQVVLGNDGVKVGGNTYINKDGLNANNKVISNVADGVNPNDAVNKGQLDAVGKEAAKHTTVKAGKNVEVTEGTNAAGGKEYTVKTADNLDVTSVKAGDSTLNTDGLTIAGGPSVKKDGINAGDKKITNVAPGAVTPTSKDAVNGSQLYNVANNVKDLIGPDATIDPATGKVTVADPAKGIGETGKGNIGDAIKHVNDAAKAAADTAKKHSSVKAGDNIVVTEGTNAAGGKEYTVSTAKDLNVDSVKAGDTTVNNDGLTIAGGPSVKKDGIDAGDKKITNVADGVDAADAVNKGQLDKVAQNVVNVLGGNATVNGNGDITMSNIGDTGKGNVNDAIKAVNDLAKKAAAEKTSVKAKDGRSNVTVTEGVNAAGGHEYTVDVERAVTEAGSDQVTVTSKHDADSNTTTYTVDVSDKTKASLAKADSAVQGLTSKDGNLNFNKDPNGNVEVSFNDNLNVKNVTTDRVQVANGPSMSKDGINAAGKAISNVANGNVAADSKDAVNGGQLYDTAKSVADVIGGGATVKDGKVVAGQNGIGNTGQNTVHGAIAAINQNTANNFNQIRGDLRKMDRDLRGGIAGALATAGLPQAFRPGKSMVAAAASTYRGQSGLAIGVSRISDNGKIILKVTGNTNSRGDFGGTIGAGYQW